MASPDDAATALLDALARLRVTAFARLDAGDDAARQAMVHAADDLDDLGPGALDLGRALVALDRGDSARAHAALGAATTAAAPDGPIGRQVLRVRARVAVEERQDALAGPLLDALPTDDLDADVLRARLRFHRGDAEEAAAALDAVLRDDPAHAEALLGAAVVELARGRVQPALAHLRRATAQQPFDPRPWRVLVKAALLVGAVEPALQWVRRILGSPLRASPACLVDLAELCLCAGHDDEAAALLTAVGRSAEVGLPQTLALARLWAELGARGAQAIDDLAARLPESPAAPMLAALALDAAGARALDAWRQAAAAGLDHWLLHARLGASAWAAGDGDTARAAASRLAGVRRPEARLLQALVAGGTPEARKTLAWAAAHPGLLPSVRRVAAAALQA
ncbi:MAG: tetratricopeptide repeat protein [Alphaproteobacteria bacterium]|nr:tetratricopeptide repeat protein [Alphaproteobacteria bacterium]